LSLLLLTFCLGSKGQAAEASPTTGETHTEVYEGYDQVYKQPCRFTVTRDEQGQLASFTLSGNFHIDPQFASGSGNYIKYPLAAELLSDYHFSWSGFGLERRFLRDGDILTGSGPDLERHQETRHKLLVIPSLKAPRSVSYRDPSSLFDYKSIFRSMQCDLAN
jgi:hypothetical protein